MAISYVGGQVAGRANPSSAVSVNFALTGGSDSVPAAGDLVIVCSVTGSAAGNPAMAVTTPTGYTALGQLNQSAVTADTSMDVSYKIMGGTPDTAVTIPGTTNNAWAEAYSIQVFRGVDAATPMDVAAVSAGGTGTGRPDPGSISPSTAGAWTVICGGGAAGTGANYVAPANYTTDFVTASGADTTDAMVGSGYNTAPATPENPAAYTGGTTGANDSWTAYTLALRPSSAVEHATSGALIGPGSTVAGTASSATTRPSSGALTGPGSTLSGSAARNQAHATDGALAGAGSTIVGSAARSGAPVTHSTTGALAGPGTTLSGAASSATTRAASGALVGSGTVIVGSAARAGALIAHAASGSLSGPGAVIVGAAGRPADTSGAGFDIPRPRRIVHHAARGRLIGQGTRLRGMTHTTRTGQNPLALVMISN